MDLTSQEKNTPFFRRKVCQRTLPQKHHFTSAKLLKFQETFLDLLFPLRKGRQKNFPPTAPLYFGKAFEIPKDFSRKVLCVGGWGRRPNIQCTHKKHGIAVLFSRPRLLPVKRGNISYYQHFGNRNIGVYIYRNRRNEHDSGNSDGHLHIHFVICLIYSG